MKGGTLAFVSLCLLAGVVVTLSERPDAALEATSPTSTPAAARLPQPADGSPISTGAAPTCGDLSGVTPRDVDHLRAFCDAWIPTELRMLRASAQGGSLRLFASSDAAATFRSLDAGLAEQLVRGWMARWRDYNDEAIVRLYSGDVELATGIPTVFNGDEVTLHHWTVSAGTRSAHRGRRGAASQ